MGASPLGPPRYALDHPSPFRQTPLADVCFNSTKITYIIYLICAFQRKAWLWWRIGERRKTKEERLTECERREPMRDLHFIFWILFLPFTCWLAIKRTNTNLIPTRKTVCIPPLPTLIWFFGSSDEKQSIHPLQFWPNKFVEPQKCTKLDWEVETAYRLNSNFQKFKQFCVGLKIFWGREG